MGYQDIDRMTSNGCECRAESLGGACNTATDEGMLAAGQMKNVRGIISSATTAQYFKIQFARPGNPRISFATNPGDGFRIAMYQGCTGTMPPPYTCPGRAQGATDLTNFSYMDNPGMNGMNQDNPRMNAWPDTVIVKVTTTTPQTACMPFDLLLQN